MAGLLADVDTNTAPSRSYSKKAVKSESRRKVRVLSPPPTQKRNRHRDVNVRETEPVAELASTPPVHDHFDMEDAVMMGDDEPMSDPLPSSPMQKVVERKAAQVTIKEEVVDEDMMEVAQPTAGHNVSEKSINVKDRKSVV